MIELLFSYVYIASVTYNIVIYKTICNGSPNVIPSPPPNVSDYIRFLCKFLFLILVT